MVKAIRDIIMREEYDYEYRQILRDSQVYVTDEVLFRELLDRSIPFVVTEDTIRIGMD